ncbi:MAG: hypothetical protein GXX85_01545 [Ignavibacteria bacterium]|nr:hypothetical protein [Ignavibacteria bacterium]
MNKLLLIKNSLQKLEKWISRNGWAGFDPYDVKEKKLILRLTELGNRYRIFEILREAIFELLLIFPKICRRLLRVEKRIIPKAMALFSTSYLMLYNKTKDEEYLIRSKECIEWLDKNAVSFKDGIGWGYPFNWQSVSLIPADTPNGIVTTACGEAYWNWYKHTGDKYYLETCIKICNFLSNLPKDEISNSQLCFSYTPLFINHVHNLNLFVAEFLIKVGKEVKNDYWISLGNKAVNYTINNQYKDGSFDYDGPPEKLRNFRDNYHTGYILRMLFSIWKLTKNKEVLNSLNKCYFHYIENFFENKRIPKLQPDKKYRIDIHSCSESIISLLSLKDLYPEGEEIALNIAEWTINNLQSEKGYFYHGIFKSRFGFTFKSRIPYIRWAEAWMFVALTNLSKVKDD